MFILYQKQDDELVLTAIAPAYTDDVEAIMLTLPDRPWKNHIVLEDTHPVVLGQVGTIQVIDWGDASTVTRTVTSEDLKSMRVRVGEFRDFMKFFSPEERLKIVGATLINPLIKLWYDNAMGGATFSLDHPETAIGLSALVSAELLIQERADQILEGDFNNLPTF